MIEINDLTDLPSGFVCDDGLSSILDDMVKKPMWVMNVNSTPGAIKYHHNYIGGLSDHTIEVIKGVIALCDSDEFGVDPLSRDYLVVAATLHDYGKLYRYTYDNVNGTIGSSGIDNITEYYHNGNYVAPCMYYTNKVLTSIKDGYNDDNIIDNLIRLIYTHHGKIEWGALENPFESNIDTISNPWILFVSDYFSSCISSYDGDRDKFINDSVDRYMVDVDDTEIGDKMRSAFDIILNHEVM